MKRAVLIFALFFSLAAAAAAQPSRCLSEQEAKKTIESIKDSSPAAENKKLRKELLDLRAERQRLNEKISADTNKNQNLIPEANQLGIRHLARVCRIIREQGWVTKETVQQDGFEAFVFLLTNNKDIQAQEELLPVMVEAAKKGQIGNPLIASMVDSIRVGRRLPQLFGTQAAIRNNVVYLYPLQNEEKIDEWRKQYDMPPLASQIRAFEGQYLMPVLKSQRLPEAPKLRREEDEKDAAALMLGLSDDENEAVTIETRLVNLNVRVLSPDLKAPVGVDLAKDDFSVSENGVEQEVTFFSNTEQPFDLVLVLDFSGSTLNKRDLIKSAARRFVELARPEDRIAVVAFATSAVVVSEFSSDKNALNQKINAIDLDGSSSIWDSVKFVYEKILSEKTVGRRSSMVLMTDAEDNSMNSTFADVMEIVRRGETTVFPVYLGRQRGAGGYSARFVRKSQQMLAMLAEETGGHSYHAADARDLSGIYEQVVNDLGKIYSLGYEPQDGARDGGWRALSVRIKNHPNLVVRTRRGYYAN